MSRLALVALLVWACSCGIHGRVPAWIAIQAATGARADQCTAYTTAWNALQKQRGTAFRILADQVRPLDSESLIRWCVFYVANLTIGSGGCYRLAVDTSLRVWTKSQFVNCHHPWARLAAQKVHITA